MDTAHSSNRNDIKHILPNTAWHRTHSSLLSRLFLMRKEEPLSSARHRAEGEGCMVEAHVVIEGMFLSRSGEGLTDMPTVHAHTQNTYQLIACMTPGGTSGRSG